MTVIVIGHLEKDPSFGCLWPSMDADCRRPTGFRKAARDPVMKINDAELTSDDEKQETRAQET
jgi:hypothetical protein